LYETRRKGEAWFIVITGNYKDIVTARRAELLLPDSVQAVQPWVKSYAQIHREIDQAK
jgi:DamX protein